MKDEEFPSEGLGVRVCVYYGTQITQTKAQMTADSRTKLKKKICGHLSNLCHLVCHYHIIFSSFD